MITVCTLYATADDEYAPEAPIPDGPTLRKMRRRAGLTTTELAAAVGVNAKTVERYEQRSVKRLNNTVAKRRLGRIVTALAA